MSKYIQFDASGKLIARYDEGFHGLRIIKDAANPDCKIPADAVEVSDELFLQTINEVDGIWKRDPATGVIAKHSFPPPTDAELAAASRIKRDGLIAAVAWRYERHARELRLNSPPTDNLAALDIYVQALADVTEQAGFPSIINWPVMA